MKNPFVIGRISLPDLTKNARPFRFWAMRHEERESSQSVIAGRAALAAARATGRTVPIAQAAAMLEDALRQRVRFPARPRDPRFA